MPEASACSYDCHIASSRWVPAGTVRQYLQHRKHAAGVLVQATDHPDCTRNFLKTLRSVPSARGVARVTGDEDGAEMRSFERCGVRGARIDLPDTGDPWDHLERLEPLHGKLPWHWHIEVGMSVAVACSLAALLARWDRTFCVALRMGRTPVQTLRHDTLRWWLDMGNVYLKLVPTVPDDNFGTWLNGVGKSAPERLVFGTGWPDAGETSAWQDAVVDLQEHADANAERLYGFPPRATCSSPAPPTPT